MNISMFLLMLKQLGIRIKKRKAAGEAASAKRPKIENPNLDDPIQKAVREAVTKADAQYAAKLEEKNNEIAALREAAEHLHDVCNSVGSQWQVMYDAVEMSDKVAKIKIKKPKSATQPDNSGTTDDVETSHDSSDPADASAQTANSASKADASVPVPLSEGAGGQGNHEEHADIEDPEDDMDSFVASDDSNWMCV